MLKNLEFMNVDLMLKNAGFVQRPVPIPAGISLRTGPNANDPCCRAATAGLWTLETALEINKIFGSA